MATISEALAIAIQHHQAGRLQVAEQIYRQILQAEPNHADAIHLLGVIAHQGGKHEIAVEYIGRAIGLKKTEAVFHNNLGNALKDGGNLDEAIACYRRALELKPGFAAAHNNLGVALKEQGKLDEAVACYRRAVELTPDYASAHNNLGNALKAQGNSDEALACYRRALELKPHFAAARNSLVAAFMAQGKLDEAVACCRRALELQPDDATAHNNLGNVLKEQGKLEEAAACYRRALELEPDDAAVHNNLGVVFTEQGKLDEAIACCRRTLELKPDDATAHNNLGNAMKVRGNLDEALACYRRALQLRPDFAAAHNNLSIALRDQGKVDEAVACCRRALELKPDYAEAHNNLGVMSEQIGDLPGAEACFRAALWHNPRFALAHYRLADFLGGTLPEKDLAAQRRLLKEKDLPDAQRLLLHFGLAHVLDARGEYTEAAAHLDRGNALQLSEWHKSGHKYNPSEHELFVTRMIEVCTPDFFERLRGFGLESELPVFVVGLPRSGTTLIEQILASHPQVFGAGEITLVGDTMAALGGEGTNTIEGLGRLNRPTVRHLASQHLERLRALDRAALRIVDKMPENYLFLGLLARLFPRAKLIHCRRDLRDVAVSCWMTHFRDIRWASDQQHIVSRFHQYQRIMEHWQKVLPVPVLEVDYAETVADLEGAARKLVAWCGLAWEPKCLEFYQAKRPVRTASAVQVRQPVFTTSVGRWKHYEQALASLFSRLERVVAEG
jgi:tetratricopeptide (TPR) repeat protein